MVAVNLWWVDVAGTTRHAWIIMRPVAAELLGIILLFTAAACSSTDEESPLGALAKSVAALRVDVAALARAVRSIPPAPVCPPEPIACANAEATATGLWSDWIKARVDDIAQQEREKVKIPAELPHVLKRLADLTDENKGGIFRLRRDLAGCAPAPPPAPTSDEESGIGSVEESTEEPQGAP